MNKRELGKEKERKLADKLLNKKLEIFNQLLGEWDLNVLDMTETHLGCIEVDELNSQSFNIYVKKYSYEKENYIFSGAVGTINKIELEKKLNKIFSENAVDKNEYYNYYGTLSDRVNWDKANADIYEKEYDISNNENEHEFN